MAGKCCCCKRWEELVIYKRLRRRHKSHFFKVLLGDFAQKLSIPRKFSVLQEKLPETVELKDPTGRMWPVELKKTRDNIFLEDGWEAFVRDHSLEEGDFLVFRFNGKACFKVLLFDISGCEKESAHSLWKQNNRTCCHIKPGKERRENSTEMWQISNPTSVIGFDNVGLESLHQATELGPPQSSSLIVRNDQGEEFDDHNDSQEVPVRVVRPRVPRSRDNTIYLNDQEIGNGSGETTKPFKRLKSTKRSTKEEKRRALQLASTVKLSHPAFLVIMRPTHVHRRFLLTIPVEFASQFLPDDDGGKAVVLHTAAGEWEVRYFRYGKVCAFRLGWKDFVVGNRLAEGDTLVFELASRKSHQRMNVRIFRRFQYGALAASTAVDVPPEQGRKPRRRL